MFEHSDCYRTEEPSPMDDKVTANGSPEFNRLKEVTFAW